MRRHQAINGGVGATATLAMATTISIQLAALAAAALRPTTTAVPAVYVFGDSLLDVGNNNYLPGADVPRANMPYYGVDFPGGARPTGRFSNGYNVADLVAKAMGFKKSPPAYLSLSRRSGRRHRLVARGIGGVNYASGGAGILDSTFAGKNIPLSKQVRNFDATKAQMVLKLGATTAKHLLSKSLFLIAIGTNDMAAFATSLAKNGQMQSHAVVAAFYSDLISNYSATITGLYGMGARKFAVINVGRIGCAPIERLQSPTGACDDGGFDDALRSLLASLGSGDDHRLDGLTYSLGDLYGLMRAIIADPPAAGFADVDSACCGGGRLGAQSVCGQPNSTLCGDRRYHLFWDYGHPTQRGAEVIASAVYDGPEQFTTPVNFEQLVRA
ncbi:GDSL esterase/lipase At5g55050-like [Miscanthus floridulus]|uniref:GDSL esterase/lipase At5g55050-like n=1 Tax=Miscanthus floridulus TaxID=154761 RepID=UPI00345B1018